MQPLILLEILILNYQLSIIIQIRDNKVRRISMARAKPMTLALSRWPGGSLSVRMAIKIRLSMPKTISNAKIAAKALILTCLPTILGG